MIVQELIKTQYGIDTDIRINPLASQVGTNVVQLLDSNPNRIAWTLVNLGENAIYVDFTPTPSASRGIYVAMTGGVLSLLWNEDFSLCAFPVYAVSPNLTCDIYIVEVIAI